MAKYWITFRLEDNRDRPRRYEALVETVQTLASMWWIEPTSFFLIDSASGIDDIAAAIKPVIDQRVDLVLIGMPEVKSARVLGNVTDKDLFTLMPFTKKA